MPSVNSQEYDASLDDIVSGIKIAIPPTSGVVAGSYNNTNIVVNSSGLITHASNGTGSGSAPSPFINVMDYGAVGDGITDDTSAIAAANAAGPCAFPIGTFLIGSDLTLNKGTIFSGGMLSIASGKTVTFNGGVLALPQQIFSGSGLVIINGLTKESYSEWWGAIADGSTDCTSFINKALAAHDRVRLLSGTYYVTSPIVINRNFSWLLGSGWEKSILLVHGSTNDGVQIVSGTATPGTTNTYQYNNRIADFSIHRDTTPSDPGATPTFSSNAGVRIRYTIRTEMENIWSLDSYQGFALNATVNVFSDKCYGVRAAGNSSNAWIGVNICGITYPNMSTRFSRCIMVDGITATSRGWYMDALTSDNFLIGCESSGCTTGMEIYGATTTTRSQVDIHLIQPVNDSFRSYGIYIHDTNTYGQVNITSGYAAPANVGSNPTCLNLNAAYGVSVKGYQCIGYPASTSIGALLTNCVQCEVDVQAQDCSIGVKVTGGTLNRITGIIRNLSLSTTDAIYLTGSTNRNYVNCGVFCSSPGAFTNGIHVDNGVGYCETNMTLVTPGGITKKLNYNGTSITTAGIYGSTNVASGVMN